MSSTKVKSSLRLRIFAGPNGSGKSTIIQQVRNYKIDGKKVDFGIYINADDIAQDLIKSRFSFFKYKFVAKLEEFNAIALSSGLINKDFTNNEFKSSFRFVSNRIVLTNRKYVDRVAQVIADFLRKKLLQLKKKFSFETVFSHQSKLDFMDQAIAAGYKVYLYFVSTNSPEINKARVLVRVKKGGHNVPPEFIERRYYRTMELLFSASQKSYQTYFWDNSENEPKLFTHFKVVNGKKKWKKINVKDAPDWFIKYYADKVKK